MALDPQQAAEWVEALDEVIDDAGLDEAARLLNRLSERARTRGAKLPTHLNTPYVNTIGPEDEVPYPGDPALEPRITSIIRRTPTATVARHHHHHPAIPPPTPTPPPPPTPAAPPLPHPP